MRGPETPGQKGPEALTKLKGTSHPKILRPCSLQVTMHSFKMLLDINNLNRTYQVNLYHCLALHSLVLPLQTDHKSLVSWLKQKREVYRSQHYYSMHYTYFSDLCQKEREIRVQLKYLVVIILLIKAGIVLDTCQRQAP